MLEPHELPVNLGVFHNDPVLKLWSSGQNDGALFISKNVINFYPTYVKMVVFQVYVQSSFARSVAVKRSLAKI